MKFTLNRRNVSILTLVLLAVFFVAFNLFVNLSVRTARLDLTENNLFTLSEGTKEILRNIEEPVTLRFFYSERLSTDYPRIRNYAGRVRDMLEEMRAVAGPELVLEVIDPEPFSEDEDRAMSLGLKGAPTTEGEVIYFGLAGTNLVDGREAIPFFTDEREVYLEYDLIRMIQNLSSPEKPVLGVVTNLPLDTGAGGLTAAMRGQSQSFMIYEEMRDRFDIQFLEQDFARVPDSVDVLLIAHPKDLNETTQYAIDQFVVKGGKAVAFFDPHSEVSLTAGPEGKPVRGYTEASNLPRLMESWGVQMDPEEIISDKAYAQRVQAGFDARRQLVDYPLWLAVRAETMDSEDLVTANIERLNLGTVGHFSQTEEATTAFEPMVTSSEQAKLLDLEYVKTGPRPDELMRDFEPTGEKYVIAARVSGPVKTAFPDGPPDPGEDEDAARYQTAEKHVAGGEAEANLILFADSDIFDDRFWVQTQSYLGERVAQPIADNAKFVLNAVENLMGADELISLRARERAERPFTVVEKLRSEAEARFLEEEEALQAKIAASEERLARLQTRAAGQQGAEELLSAREADEMRRIRQDLVESRMELRDVQRNLRRDIDQLGSQVRFINVALMPILVAFAALGVAWYRRRRRLKYSGR
ncbi:Gldg family protein [Tepidicaulis sp. LMO-SS28]|uniref:GldG family protein n=1 Tax=Tepidicaulis sp. LMO-SS28 TaxID=3447455 RepID=UPI003EDF04BB